MWKGAKNMLNLLRAQWYRIGRNRAFWGLLLLFAVIMVWDLVSIGQNYRGQEGFGSLPPLFSSGTISLDPETYLGEGGIVYFLVPLVLLLVAVLFADDFREGTVRNLAASPAFRRDYVLASALTVGLIAIAFVAVALVAVWAIIPQFPLLGVAWAPGRFLRWACQLVLIVELYGMLTVAVAVMAKRLAPTLIAAFLLGAGQVELLLANGYVMVGQVMELIGLPGLPGVAKAGAAIYEELALLPGWLPAAQLQWMMGEGATPTIADMAPMALAVAAAVGLCLLAMRRRSL